MTEIALQPEAHSASAIRQHVELLHNAAKGVDGVLVVSTFFASPNREEDRPGTVTHHNVGDIDGMVDAIEAHAETPEANVYVGLQVMRKGLGRGKRGTESDIVAVLGLVADMDADTGKVGQLPFEPSLILETSPGNKQPFWMFDKPLTPAVAKPIAAALRLATSSDFGTADISHVWRVPGTLNWPNAKKIERGRDREPAKVTVLREWDGSFVDTTAFAVTVGAASGSTSGETRQVNLDSLPDVDGISVSIVATELLQSDGKPDRSTHAARVVERLSFDGHTPEEALALIKACEGEWKGTYKSDQSLNTDFLRLWSKFGKLSEPVSVDFAKLSNKGRQHPTADNDNEPTVARKDNRAETKPYQGIVSSGELVRGFTPPDYHIDGVIQARFFYSLTGMTGTGKTAVLLLMAASTALNLAIGGREVRSGRVLYFAGENPDDVTMRWIAMAHEMGFDADLIDVHFIKGTLNVNEMFARIKADVNRLGGVDMIVVDTSAAYFFGTDENSNVEAGNHARSLRKLCELPGGPVVLVACHPIKNAGADNLLPRGGGAFIAEVDGNLTLAKADGMVKMHWQGKHRGPDFEPIAFKLKTSTAPALVDTRGRPVPTVLAEDLTPQEVSAANRQVFSDLDAILIEIERDGTQSTPAMAESNGWHKDGKPDKRRVQTATDRLKREKLARYEARKWKLTEAGYEALTDAKARRHSEGQAADFAARMREKMG